MCIEHLHPCVKFGGLLSFDGSIYALRCKRKPINYPTFQNLKVFF